MKNVGCSLFYLAMASFSDIASSQAVTGKIVIDNQEYISGSSNVVQGNGKQAVDKRKLNAFNKLAVDISADVEFIASDKFQLELVADKNIVPLISSNINDDTLLIATNHSFSTKNKIHIKIYGSPSLSNVIVDGSSDISLVGIKSHSLNITLEGSGDFVAQGQVKNLKLSVNGSGDVNTRKLLADNVSVLLDGAADINVTSVKKLDVFIDGAGDVTYYGHPGMVNKKIDGAGDISSGD